MAGDELVNKRKVLKFGGSLVITIPSYVVEQLHLSKGDTLAWDYIDRRDGSTPFFKLWKTTEEEQATQKPKPVSETPGVQI